MIKFGYFDIANLTDNFHYNEDFCEKRIKYIERIVDSNRKKQSYYSWFLLVKILIEMGYNPKELCFNRLDTGKWICNNNIKFSISHSNNLVAVIVSDNADCSIDVQYCKQSIFKVINKIKKSLNAFDENMLDIITATKLFTCYELRVKGLYDILNSIVVQDSIKNNYVLSYSYEDMGDKPQLINIKFK